MAEHLPGCDIRGGWICATGCPLARGDVMTITPPTGPPTCAICGGRRWVIEPDRPLICLTCSPSGGRADHHMAEQHKPPGQVADQ